MKQFLGICLAFLIMGCSSNSSQVSETESAQIQQLDSLVTDLDQSKKAIDQSVKAVEDALKDL